MFSATDQVERNILRLLDMVETPYFSKETVDKEKELLLKKLKCIKNNQDIKLCSIHYAMYHHHPIKVDIAGSVESIYSITKDDLYLCYETFYHPSNMVLFVVGDVDPKRICNVIEEHENRRHKTNQPSIQRGAIKRTK